jgi:NADPH2:quinone reductase
MRAAVYERRGPAREVLRIVDRPIPEPAANEVRVKIAVSSVNPTDIKARVLDHSEPLPNILRSQLLLRGSCLSARASRKGLRSPSRC